MYSVHTHVSLNIYIYIYISTASARRGYRARTIFREDMPRILKKKKNQEDSRVDRPVCRPAARKI